MFNENYYRTDEYNDLLQEVIEEHDDLEFINTCGVAIDIVSSNIKKNKGNGKVYAECVLIKNFYTLYCPYDFLIIIYEKNIEHLSHNQLKILLYHELLHIGLSEKDGEPVYTINPHDIEDFRAVIEKYGHKWAD